jgi:membrane protein
MVLFTRLSSEALPARPAGAAALWRRLGATRPARLLGLLLSRDVQVLTNAIAFNVLMCLFPLLVVVASASQALPGSRRAGTAIYLLLRELIPFGHAALLDSLHTLTRTARGVEVFSLLLVIWGSSGIFMPVEMVLGRAWGGRRTRSFGRSRVLAFLMTLLGGSLALASVAVTVLARSYGTRSLAGAYGAKGSALLLTYVLFFAVYRLVPSFPVPTRVALRAAVLAGTGWEVMKYLFVVRLARMNLAAFYGPLAFAVSLVLWAYVSSLVLVLGALLAPLEEGAGGASP